MAVILHIETATQVCSVALSIDGKLSGILESSEKNIHSSVITVFIEKIMNQAGIEFNALDAIAVSMGPGSYTGLRIGVSTAKGICFALDKPLIAIGTLDSMAAGMRETLSQVENPTHNWLYCPMIDARRLEVYSAVYDEQLVSVRKTEAEIITKNSFSELLKKNVIWLAGDGAGKCIPILGDNPNVRFLENYKPSARYMVKLAESKFTLSKFENIAYFEPFYLKDFIPGIPKVKGLM